MKKWKRPTSCKIGALKYKIKYVKAGKTKYLEIREAGCIDQHTTTIYIDSQQDTQMQLLTLMHEFIHGMAFVIYPNKSSDFRENLATGGAELLLQALQSSGLLSS